MADEIERRRFRQVVAQEIKASLTGKVKSKSNNAQPPRDNWLTVTVVYYDTNEEMAFSIKRTKRLSKLQDAYADRVGKDVSSLRFLYNWNRINPDDTPAGLGMQDNDEIIAMVARRENDQRLPTVKQEDDPKVKQEDDPKVEQEDDPSEVLLNIQVVTATGYELRFKMKRSTRLAKLLDAYANKSGMDAFSLRFFYHRNADEHWNQISPDDTPGSLGMQDNDKILAKFVMRGD